MKNSKLLLALALSINITGVIAQEPTTISPSAQMTVHGGSMSVWGNMSNSANSSQNGALTLKDGAKIIFYGTTWENNNATNIVGEALLSGEVDFVNPRPAPYAGSFSQNLNGGGENQSFPSLRVSNSRNVILLSNLARVRGTLTFAVDDGHIISNGNNLVIGNGTTTAGTITGYNPLRYFVTNRCGVGHLVRNGFNSTAQVFPVGMAEDDYTPVSILPNAAISTASANVCNYANSPSNELLLLSGGINRTWNIFSNTGADAQITLQHNATTNNSGGGGLLSYSDQNAFVVQSTTLGVWQNYINPPATFATGTLQDGGGAISGSAMHTRNYTLTANSSDLSANFTKDFSGMVLPVSGLTFTGHRNSNKVVLDWKVLSEYNVASYEVTRSLNGTDFNKVGTQRAADRSNAFYSFADDITGISANKLYYRLRMTDKDGNVKLSNVVLINLDKQEAVTVYPNPASSVLNISLSVTIAQRAEMVLYNTSGQAMKRQVVNLLPGSQTIQLKGLETLSKGQYELFIKLNNGNTIQQKVMVLH